MRFPRLKTGALAQYPARRDVEYGTQVVTFVDGGEQRWARRGAAVKRWVIRLELLDETELSRVAEFFGAAEARAQSFEFEDPWTGVVHADCSLESDELEVTLAGEMRASTTLIIRENTE